MKKIWMSGLLAVVLFVGGTGATGAASEEKKKPVYPQTEIVLTGKKEARFSHLTHVNLNMSCGVCHHDVKHVALTEVDIAGIQDVAKIACANCHNETFQVESLRDRKAIFHGRCKECHQKGYADKKGPTNCNGCHVKQ
ncbi:MAG: hypothetical protein A2511_03910 [Deltaproteobacteria bacterium RIFOXYD12_FULL_50_9]|nr:MAG: hypothetical protein A2511_03910 [Deltaproteobacteria bacterium RIFOXYD12_FULL_50_9]